MVDPNGFDIRLVSLKGFDSRLLSSSGDMLPVIRWVEELVLPSSGVTETSSCELFCDANGL